MRRSALTAAAALAALTLAACGSSTGSNAGAAGQPSTGASISGTVTVFAAASLQESFTTLGREFEADHPGAKVVFSFGPSSGLATQITQGAPADVFASASTKNMDQVVQAGDATSPTTFAGNILQIAVPPANPGKVTALKDLARPGLKVAVCQPAVPCGVLAAKVFSNAGITVEPTTQETDVKAVLAKVTLGEVDAGLVYVTDVRAAKVTGIDIPADLNATTDYPIATLSKAPNAKAAQAFTAFVLSPRGRAALTSAGFTAP